jgi:hypothetical protein
MGGEEGASSLTFADKPSSTPMTQPQDAGPRQGIAIEASRFQLAPLSIASDYKWHHSQLQSISIDSGSNYNRLQLRVVPPKQSIAIEASRCQLAPISVAIDCN